MVALGPREGVSSCDSSRPVGCLYLRGPTRWLCWAARDRIFLLVSLFSRFWEMSNTMKGSAGGGFLDMRNGLVGARLLGDQASPPT